MKPYHVKSASINVRDELATIIEREMEFVDLLVTIVKCDVSPDMRNVKAFIAVLPEGKSGSALKLLQKSASRLAALLAKRVKMKYIPKISFSSDEGGKNAATVLEILDQLKKDEETNLQNKTQNVQKNS